MNETASSPRLTPISFEAIAGWPDDDHAAAFRAFRRGAAVLGAHPPKQRGLGTDAEALARVLAKAARFPEATPRPEARLFFEAEFVPHEVAVPAFFTGYYEPIVAGSRKRSPQFGVPLYAPPDDLVEIEPGSVAGLDPSFRFARRTAAGLGEHPDRGAIEAGALRGRGLEIAWLADPVDAFFIHIQGAARIRLAEGGEMRVTYAAKSGHPYTPIGRVLIERGALDRSAATMEEIRAWLAAHPGEAPAAMAENRSFIFFREAPVDNSDLGPIAATKVPLTPGRSLAVDRLLHSFHLPVFVDTTLPGGAPFRQLLIAQDTGSAIVGPARGDIFFGSGEEAGAIAGSMKAPGRFIALVPRGTR